MLKKVIKIGDKEVAFRSSATIPRLYRAKFKRDIFGSSKVAPAKSTVKKNNTGKTYSSLFGNSNGLNRSYEPIPTLGRR